MDLEGTARKLEDVLGLQSPPIAIAFVDRPPEGLEEFTGTSPSACSFWRYAEAGPFFAPAGAHGNCAVGAMVMGLDSPELQSDLAASVDKMITASYLSPEEPASIPSVRTGSAGLVYGLLRDFPLNPDVVLMWLSPVQAMLFGEAGGIVAWSGSSPGVLGRPACAALPLAMGTGRPQLSLGCIGMRTFTEVSEDRLLAVLPGPAASSFTYSLRVAKDANAQMAAYYQERKHLSMAAGSSGSEARELREL